MDGSGFGDAARVAVLVDGDNVSSRHAGAVMTEAARLGRVDVRRVYGDAAKCNAWDGFRVVHAGGAKNAADMHLVVDAMALVLGEGIGAVVIASSDGDFAPVALALRERGVTVVGVGGSRASLRFKAACVRFVEAETSIPDASEPVEIDTDKTPIAAGKKLAPAEANAREVIRATGGLGLELGRLAGRLGKVPDGAKTWRAFFEARPDLFVCDPKGPQAKVRLAPAGAKLR